jgi:hypothetical protein
LRKTLLKEINFLHHEGLSNPIAIYNQDFPTQGIFPLVKDHRYVIAYDDQLKPIPTITFDTTFVVFTILWMESTQTLFIAGNFGWLRTVRFKSELSIQCV